MGFIGVGQPGQQERTIVDEDSEVKQPWKIWKHSAKATALVVWLLFAGFVAIWLWTAFMIGWNKVEMSYGDPEWLHYWRTFVYGVVSVGRMLRLAWIVPVLGTILAWCGHALVLVGWRYIPEQLNRNWPPPFGPVAVEDAGALTFWNADQFLHDEKEPEPEPSMRIDHVAQRKETGNGLVRESFLIPLPKGGEKQLAQYAKAILAGVATFSEGGGRSVNGAMSYGYTKNQYRDELKSTFIRHHYVKDGGNAGVTWTGKGMCFLAQAVYHQYGIDGVPAEYWRYLPESVRPSDGHNSSTEIASDGENQGRGVVALKHNGGNGHAIDNE